MAAPLTLVEGKWYRFRPPETSYPFDWSIIKRDKDGYIRCKFVRILTAGPSKGQALIMVRIPNGFEKPRWLEAERLEEIV